MKQNKSNNSTQIFLEIEDVVDNIVLHSDGGCALVMETGAVNFALLSKEEQESIIYAFANFLNSLSFPIQILILSKRMRISDYLNYIEGASKEQKSMRIKEKLTAYHQFILSLVKDNHVLEKRFFIVIPFLSLELGVKGSGSSLVKKSKKLPYPKHYILDRAKTTLYPKRDHILRQIGRLGLKAVQLSNQQLVSLFYELYNEEAEEGVRIPEGVASPMVAQTR